MEFENMRLVPESHLEDCRCPNCVGADEIETNPTEVPYAHEVGRTRQTSIARELGWGE